MKHLFLSIFALIAMMMPCAAGAAALPDSSAYKVFAEQVRKDVWAMDLPEFRNTKCPDSLKSRSMVLLAEYDEVNIDRHGKGNALEMILTWQNSSVLKCINLKRMLIAINDEATLKTFSKYDFLASSRNYWNKSQTVLGVKIIKPDGSIKIVDADDYVTSVEGKNGKSTRQKLAIPGLQVGDVLDLFTYNIDDMTSKPFLPFNFKFKLGVPQLSLRVHCVLDPDLAVHYRTLNGAPDFVQSTDSTGNIVLDVEKKNMTDVTPEAFYLDKKQTPQTLLYVYDRKVINTIYIKSLKKKGLQANPDVAPIQKDAWTNFNYSKQYIGGLFGLKVEGLGKFRSNLPQDMPDEEKADRIYKYLTFGIYCNTDQFSEDEFMYLFDESLTKTGVPHEVILTTTTDNEPIDQLICFNNTKSGIRLSDSGKLYFSPSVCLEPSIIPENVQGRKAISRENGEFTIPVSKPTENVDSCAKTISIDGAAVNIVSRNYVTGGEKGFPARVFITREDEMSSYIKYLGLNKNVNEICGKKSADDVKEIFRKDREEVKDNVKLLINSFYGDNNVNLKSFGIEQLGNRADSTTMIYRLEYGRDGLVKNAGQDLIVSVGKLVCHQLKIEGENRKRTVDVNIKAPFEYIENITLNLPDGYSVSPENVAKLNTETSNSCGSFTTKATCEGGKLHLFLKKCYNNAVVPAAEWSSFLKFIDIASAFNDAQIVLHSEK